MANLDDSSSWIKDLLSKGLNNPDLSRLLEITIEIFFPILLALALSEKKFVTAIGIALTVPSETVTSNASNKEV